MQQKKTLVIGASENPARYSNMAIKSLVKHGQEVIAIGKKKGRVANIDILTTVPSVIKNLDTITLYINPLHQKEYYSYILSLKPKRIIFNPGTENEELSALASQNNIHAQEACTLVLLNTGQF